MRACWRTALALSVAFAWLAQCCAADSFQDLLKRVPDQANAVLLVDVQALHRCPIGKREKWAQKHQQDYLSGLSSLPPTATKLLVAAQFDPAALHATWKIGLVEVRQQMDLSDIASAEGSPMDTVAGQPAVVSSRNAYTVSLGPKLLASMQPANRQALGRWLRFAKRNTRVAVSPYLQEAAATVGDRGQVVFAVDMTDVMDPDGLRARLKHCKALAGQSADLDQLAKLLAGMQGLRFTIQAEDAISGELRLDLGSNAEALAPIAKGLVLEALGSMGAHITALEDRRVRTDGNAVILSGGLSAREARQIVSVLHPPPTAVLENKSAEESPGHLMQDPKTVASQRYFSSVTTLVKEMNQQKAPTYNKLAYWLYQYSQKIDNLPMLNVDSELLNYGASVSAALRGLSEVAKGTLYQQKYAVGNSGEALVNLPTGNSYYGYGYNRFGQSWGYNYYVPDQGIVNNYGQVNNLLATSGASEAVNRQQTLNNIDNATRQVRQKMVQKYKVEF